MSYRRKDKTQSLPLYDEESIHHTNSHKEYDSLLLKSQFTPRRSSKLGSRVKFFGTLVLLWVVTIHYFERIVPRQTMKACQWNKWETWGDGISGTPHRVALVADPQIVDAHTYPNNSRIFNYFTTMLSDNYLKRNHRFMHTILDPDSTLFLGDLFDGGREWDNYDVWFDEYERFCDIFPEPANRRTIKSIPGNHDIGYQTIDPKIRSRFLTFFGELNDFIEIGNHTIIMMDTISLSHPDKGISQDSKDFLQSLNQNSNPQLPRILLSHVPLYRFPDEEKCGPLREKGDPFPLQRGKEYQTVLDYEVSQDLLRTISPEIIFSGDDHDYCHVRHKFRNHEGADKIAEEISCKTVSMTCGVKYPALQLLSLYNPYDPKPKTQKERESNKSYQTKICFLPLPYTALSFYFAKFIVGILLLALVYVFPDTLVSLLDYIRAYKFKYFFKENVNQERDLASFTINSVFLLVTVYLTLQFYHWYI